MSSETSQTLSPKSESWPFSRGENCGHRHRITLRGSARTPSLLVNPINKSLRSCCWLKHVSRCKTSYASLNTMNCLSSRKRTSSIFLLRRKPFCWTESAVNLCKIVTCFLRRKSPATLLPSGLPVNSSFCKNSLM